MEEKEHEENSKYEYGVNGWTGKLKKEPEKKKEKEEPKQEPKQDPKEGIKEVFGSC